MTSTQPDVTQLPQPLRGLRAWRGLVLVLTLGAPLAACSEKNGAKAGGGGGGGGEKTGTETGEGIDGDGTDTVSGGGGDPCKDGFLKADLPSSLATIAKKYCDNYASDLQKESAVYGQADFDADDQAADLKKIVDEERKDESGDQVSYLMLAANALDTTPKAYFDLNKLRYNKPDVYAKTFAYNPKTKVCKVQAGDATTALETLSNADEDVVHYTADVTYYTIQKDAAYLVSTVLKDNFQESLRDLKSLALIIPGKSNKTLVYTVAFQKVYKHDQDDDTILGKAKRNLRDEMRRDFENAAKASKATGLLSSASTPPASCD
jgi:hypothetical protein